MTKLARFALIALLVFLAFFSIPVSAQRLEKKASGKGQVNPSGECVVGSDNGGNDPCVILDQTSATTGTWTNVLASTSVDGPFDLFMVPQGRHT